MFCARNETMNKLSSIRLGWDAGYYIVDGDIAT